jgi:N-acetylglucosamine malate deacetylase 1
MHILVLTAHPDDAEVSAGGTIARMVEEGSTVENVLISDRSVWTGQTEAEMAAAARALGIEASPHLISALEFDSGPTEWRLHQAATAVEEHVGSPDLIITHDLEDSHQDHRFVSQVATILNRRNRASLWYMDHSVSGGLSPDRRRPNLYVTLTGGQHRAKLASVAAYRSQVDKYGPRWLAAVHDRDRYYGGILGVAAAEGFVVPFARL